MGGNALTETMVFGARAGEAAAAWVKETGKSKGDIPFQESDLPVAQSKQKRTKSNPAQLTGRLREILWERGGEAAFQDKYATSIITSIHFCDDFPMNYIHGVSEDLGMKYVTGYSIHMNDMDYKEKRKGMSLFSRYF